MPEQDLHTPILHIYVRFMYIDIHIFSVYTVLCCRDLQKVLERLLLFKKIGLNKQTNRFT